MVSADYLFLMTDVDCLYTTNPRNDPNARPITTVWDISTLAADVSSSGSPLGTGGMSTKIVAARLAISAGVTTIITRSSKPGNVREIVHYDQLLRLQAQNQSLDSAVTSPIENPALPEPPLHTRFIPSSNPVRDRSFWLLHGLTAHGTVYIDEGAHKALRNKAGLLPVGIVDVEGHFSQQEAVRLVVVRRSQPATAPHPIMPASEMGGDRPRHEDLSTTKAARKVGASSEEATQMLDSGNASIAHRRNVSAAGTSSRNNVKAMESSNGLDQHTMESPSISDVGFTEALSQLDVSSTERPDAPPTPGTPAAALFAGGLGGYESGIEFPLPGTRASLLPLRGLSPGPSHTATLAISASAALIDASRPPREVGRALVNYASTEILRIKGLKSAEIEGVLGYADSEYVALRENVSLFKVEEAKDQKRMGDLAGFV